MASNSETIELLGDVGANAGRDALAAAGREQAGPLEEDGSAESEEEPEPLSKEAVKQRRTLMRRISSYKAVFPELLGEIASELEGLVHKSPEELATLLEEVQFLVETRRSTAQARGLFLAGLSMGEAAGPYVGLKLAGLASVASQSPDLLTSVDECALRYEGVVQVDPAVRLMMAIGQLCLAVDGANRAREAGALANAVVAQPPTTPVAETTTPVAEPSPPLPRPANNNTREMFNDL